MSSQQKNINHLQTKIQNLEEEFLYIDDSPYSEKIETLQDRCDALVQIIEIQAQRVCILYSIINTWTNTEKVLNSFD
jgi:hypothetical protein